MKYNVKEIMKEAHSMVRWMFKQGYEGSYAAALSFQMKRRWAFAKGDIVEADGTIIKKEEAKKELSYDDIKKVASKLRAKGQYTVADHVQNGDYTEEVVTEIPGKPYVKVEFLFNGDFLAKEFIVLK
ncbi:hypothetical protein [Vagococcus carniphilus]|uniref:hypothetical protein n=1 Tax=Vagococcus carniphilus TaxID=218144 RepID=UPI003BABCDB6